MAQSATHQRMFVCDGLQHGRIRRREKEFNCTQWKPKQLIIKDCARRFVLKLYRHEASRGLFATTEHLVTFKGTVFKLLFWVRVIVRVRVRTHLFATAPQKMCPRMFLHWFACCRSVGLFVCSNRIVPEDTLFSASFTPYLLAVGVGWRLLA